MRSRVVLVNLLDASLCGWYSQSHRLCQICRVRCHGKEEKELRENSKFEMARNIDTRKLQLMRISFDDILAFKVQRSTMTTMKMLTCFLLSLLIFSCVSSVSTMTDTATGISFPAITNGLECFGVGVRKKGPIKIYSVAMYSDFKEKLASMSRSAEKGKKALKTLRDGAQESPTSFMLEMSFKVGSEKMASAIADAVAPRYTGSSSDVDSLKGLIMSGVASKGAAVKGTTLQFDCSSSGVDVAVDGQAQGGVPSPKLAKAFCDVYLDDKCASPALRESCLENCCEP